MSDSLKPVNSSRWWEYYFVRYFIGTIVGAGAILTFNEYSASPLKGTIFPAVSNLRDAGVYHLVALVGLGLAYCYIASAPMLTIHALRGGMQRDLSRRFSPMSLWFLGILALLALAAYWLLSLDPRSWNFLAAIFVCVVLALQVSMFIDAGRNGFRAVTRYYKRLTKSRASPQPEVREYIESYRHLREHGNAFAIILFELGFAMAAISMPSLGLLSALLLLWVAPAAAVWVVGTIMESQLEQFASASERND